jgi:hypothetical protein
MRGVGSLQSALASRNTKQQSKGEYLNVHRLKQISKIAFVVLAAVAAGYGVKYLWFKGENSPHFAVSRKTAQVVHAGSKTAEYTVTLVHKTTSGPAWRQGAPRVSDQIVGRTVIAVRKDGSMSASMITLPVPGTAAKEVQYREILDVSQKKKILYIPEVAAKSTTSISDRHAAGVISHPALEQECSTTQLTISRRDNILGFAAVALKDPSGAESWVIPDLNCLSVKSVRENKNHLGQLVSTSYIDVERITVATPNPALFDTPGIEMSPSDVYRKIGQYQGIDPAKTEMGLSQKMDEKWLAEHSSEVNRSKK